MSLLKRFARHLLESFRAEFAEAREAREAVYNSFRWDDGSTI